MRRAALGLATIDFARVGERLAVIRNERQVGTVSASPNAAAVDDRRYHWPVVTSVERLELRNGYLQWTVGTDRGCQYTSAAYRRILKTLGIQCSMSRTACCDDNAVMERFFWSIKNEWTNHVPFADLESARLSVFKYIDTFYNPVRLHQTLGYRSPDQYEAVLAPATAA